MADSSYVGLARALSRDAFVSSHAGYFLVKRPRSGVSAGQMPKGMGFATVATAVDYDPYWQDWQIFPVAKRPGIPFPEQISVGRATNCDVVLRVPSVSKVQLHILCGHDGAFSIRDARGSSPISLNRKKLEPGEVQPLMCKDLISFGAFDFEFVDARHLYDIIKSKAP